MTGKKGLKFRVQGFMGLGLEIQKRGLMVLG
jgi:hypothetical protein